MSAYTKPDVGASNHIVAPRFQNRRAKSRLLKHAFPAGFYNKRTTQTDLQAAEAKITKLPPTSFMEWTKGSVSVDDAIRQTKDDDPWSGCAGPFFEELMRQRTAESAGHLRTVNDVNAGLFQLQTNPVSVHERSPDKLVSF